MLPHDSPSVLRVLIVEDLHDSADTLALLLRVWGYEPCVAYDGPSALLAAATHAPDVVLLDIGLPTMDGCEVASQLRLLPQTKKSLLLAITGYGQEEDIRRCKDAGIDGHFLKPVDPTQLRGVLLQAENSCGSKLDLPAGSATDG